MARLVILGEAPGADEDAAGRPFVGRAGKVLDGLLGEAGLSRSAVYVTNTVLCRPPDNLPPSRQEVAACSPYLDAQLKAIRPRAVLALGATAVERLLGPRRIASVAGTVVDGHPAIVASYHPSALNRHPDRRRFASVATRLAAQLSRGVAGGVR
jgi:uracil-DNA glycosylase family 4